MDNRHQVVNVERLQALETWLKSTGIKIRQVNGQRRFGGPPKEWDGPTPGPNCEVFISHIPRDTFENMLIPLFSAVGPLWEFRLMMNFSGQNRGFAYAKYASADIAKDAITQLHGHKLQPGVQISVCRSTEKKHLCITNLPANTKPGHLLQVLRGLTEGVERLSLTAGPGIDGVSAQVCFSSHHNASMAKRMLAEAFQQRCNLRISVMWMTHMRGSDDSSFVASQPNLPSSIVKAPPNLAPPLGLQCPLPIPSDFCRAVGAPIDRKSERVKHVPILPASPLMLLQKLHFGRPHFEFQCSHAGPDGFIHFTYKVCLSGVGFIFSGRLAILAGPTAATTLEVAKEAAALQVLKAMQSAGFHL
ncbi:dead end protein 1 [Nerophis lumbriciformis]|uniref:dead end protein 1 n=1 Tax=Nerophis lumbriciformis TaxID=546530 RepID=UPI002ADF0374|nr:dead end protein 1-like [Nerophis lumbriciformis]